MRSVRLQRLFGLSSALFVTLFTLLLFASSPAFAQPADGPSTAFTQTQHSAQQVRQAWVALYNGLDNGPDRGIALTVDEQGNVYVVGYTGFYGPATNSGDYATLKYSSTGQLLWEQRYNGPGNSYDYPNTIALDEQGNVYVTGYSVGSSYDYATLKYDPNGNLLWEQRYNGPGNSYDGATSMAVDKQGNVYVTGNSVGSSMSSDYATLKYDPNGNLLWEQRYNGPGNSYDYPRAIALDEQGNVYVTGDSDGSDTGTDYATLKYDPSGNLLWKQRYNAPGNSNDGATSMAVDKQGNVYVTGYSVGSSMSSDYAILKYDPNGNLLWEQRYNGPGNSYDYPRAIALDKQGNVYVTGVSDGSDTGNDYATLKYDPSGNLLWKQRYNALGNSNDEATSMAVDKWGNVYVTGDSDGDYATLKYDTNGKLIWEQRYNNRLDFATALAVDKEGNVYVTGGNGDDFATIKYSQGSGW